MTIKILELTSVGDQKENKNTKNRFFFIFVIPVNKKKKNPLLVFLKRLRFQRKY